MQAGDLVARRKLVLIIGIVILIIGLKINMLRPQKKELNFCFNFPWRNLHPGTQNTLIGGLIISQQFESLVKISHDGNLAPSLAKSWNVSDDFKRIYFKLDETKLFTNGKHITSQDVLNSWEASLEMSKEGTNNSLKDVLYNLEGFSDGTKLKNISGFKIKNDYEFELVFKEPFRLAIYHLRGARFAIYSKENNKLVGSGRFVYDLDSKAEEIKLIDTTGITDFKIKVKPKGESLDIIQSGICDVLFSPQGNIPKSTNLYENIKHIESEDAVHLILTLNTKKGIFSNVKMRRAFLYLINKDPIVSKSFVGRDSLNTPDPQLYNVMAQGRLDDEEVKQIIDSGSQWIDEFYEKLKKKNLSFLINDKSFLKPAFELAGISSLVKQVEGDSSLITKLTYNGNLEEDFTAGFLSVLSFDPDGIYHALGRNGAILNPYMENETIFTLLEEGRKITDLSKLDEFYKKVSRVFLSEVPFIHLGFSKNVLLFNSNKLNIESDSFKNTLDFGSFVGK